LGWSVSEQAATGARHRAPDNVGFEFGLKALIAGFEKLRRS
jgi:hypothetical protein